MADAWKNRWKASSQTEVGKEYIIGQKEDGVWGCSCPAWRFAHAPKPDCKHITAFKENLGVLPAARFSEPAPKRGALGVAAGGVSAIQQAIAKVSVRINGDTMQVESILLTTKRKISITD